MKTHSAQRFVAAPGYSEHHTGLALDFVAEIGGRWLIESKEIIERAEELQPVYDLLPKYGFILRYLKGKEEITGVSGGALAHPLCGRSRDRGPDRSTGDRA